MELAPWLSRSLERLKEQAQANTAPVLLHGHQVKGLLDLVNAFVAIALCEASEGTKRPCAQCAACHMRLGGNHPDLRYLMPQAVVEQLGMPLELKSGVKPSRDIRIDDVRELQGFFNTFCSDLSF